VLIAGSVGLQDLSRELHCYYRTNPLQLEWCSSRSKIAIHEPYISGLVFIHRRQMLSLFRMKALVDTMILVAERGLDS
jgi:hypothetical protein